MQNHVLLRNIVQELQYVPSEYLKTLFEVIHAFRLNLPSVPSEKQEQHNIDWDSLLEEVMQNRQHNNQKEFNKIDALFEDEKHEK